MLKKTILSAIATLAILCTSLSCSDKDNEPQPAEMEDGTVQLVIRQYQMDNGTRAAGATPSNPTTQETNLNGSIRVVVFNSSDEVEFNRSLTLTTASGVTTTSSFHLSGGNKKFFLYANAPTATGSDLDSQLAALAINTPIATLDALIGDITFDLTPTGTGRPSIAIDNNFLNQSLWDPQAVTINGTGTTATPERVTVSIGRQSAKINFTDVTTGGTLPGSFGTFNFTLNSVPNRYYVRGQYNATGTSIVPPGNHNEVTYTSAVHNEGWEDPLNTGQQNPIFINYDFATPTSPAVPGVLYAIENTTDPATGGVGTTDLFYGNTTYISLRTTYTPNVAGGEVFDPDMRTAVTTLPTTDFWVADDAFDNKRKLFSTDPGASTNASDYTNISQCTAGVMYWKFPVRDPYENVQANQCRVIRNHEYRLDVTAINNYGDGTSTNPPDKVIEDDGHVEVEVEVLGWYAVDYSFEL